MRVLNAHIPMNRIPSANSTSLSPPEYSRWDATQMGGRNCPTAVPGRASRKGPVRRTGGALESGHTKVTSAPAGSSRGSSAIRGGPLGRSSRSNVSIAVRPSPDRGNCSDNCPYGSLADKTLTEVVQMNEAPALAA